MDCQVSLAQINPTLGDLHVNLERHLESIEAAAATGSELVLFPELSLTGYFLRDQVFDLARPLDDPLLARLTDESRRLSIGVGLVERARDGRCFNAYAFLEDGRVRHVHRKVHLVTYGMFDDAREFAAGESFVPVDSRLGRFGVLLCEDLWHPPSGWLYFLAGVDALIVPSASPGRGVGAEAGATSALGGLESVGTWETLLRAQALSTQTWLLYVNRVGWEDGIAFAGGSCAYDPFGTRVAGLAELEPGRLEVHLRASELERARWTTPLLRDAKPWLVERELARVRAEAR